MRRIRFWALAFISFSTTTVVTLFSPDTFLMRALSIASCRISSLNSTFCAANLILSPDRVMAANPPVFVRTMQIQYSHAKYNAMPSYTSSQRLAQSIYLADGSVSNSGNKGYSTPSEPNSRQYVFPKKPTKGTTSYEVQTFENCKDAQNYIDSLNKVKKSYVAIADSELYFVERPSVIVPPKQPNGPYTAKVTVDYRIDKIVYILPQWTWANMTPDEGAALQSYMDALWVHEEGHTAIAESFARLFSRSETFDGTGDTPKKAEENLKAKLLQELAKRREELRQDEENYDDITQNGAAQSEGSVRDYPGGKDVVLKCPDKKPKENYKQGKSYGDPHLITFDGLSYSFQTVGEFILVKSNYGKFEVQIRHAPVNSSLSLNNAVAMKVGSDRVAFYSKEFPDSDTSTPIRINGKPTVIQGDSLSLPSGNTIAKSGDAYVVNFSTGEKVLVDTAQFGGNFYFNVSPFVSDSQPDRYSGLLGNANGDPKDDQQIRGGAVLSSKSTYGDVKQVLNLVGVGRLPFSLDAGEKLYFDQLYKEFGNSWRIKQNESLFDYSPGKTTESYTNRNFPDKYLKLEMLSSQQIEKARSACTEAGIDPTMMEGCIFDVGFTGFTEFARATAEISSYFNTVQRLFPGLNVPLPVKVPTNPLDVPRSVCLPFVGCIDR